jgi:hypothetical protein
VASGKGRSSALTDEVDDTAAAAGLDSGGHAASVAAARGVQPEVLLAAVEGASRLLLFRDTHQQLAQRWGSGPKCLRVRSAACLCTLHALYCSWLLSITAPHTY